MATYIEHAQLAAQQWTDDLLCGEGSFDIFPTMKALVHNIGFRCWVGPEATRKNYMPRLIAAYEELDPEAGFQDLTRLTATLALGKLKEKAALDELESILTEIWEAKTRSLGRDPLQCPELNGEAAEDPDNLTALHRLHAHRSEADRRRQVAIDVFHFHLASQANMYAALSWTLANLLTQSGGHLEAVLVEMDHARATFGPEYRGSTGALDGMLRLEAVIQESLRLAQQSITLRKVLRPVSFSYEGGTLRLDPGMYIATLLSVTNKCNRHVPNHPPLAEFFPERYTLSSSNRSGGVELDPEIYPEAVHVHLSTFGRGFHACPGQRFAMYIMKIAITKLLETCELTPQFEAPEIPSASVGAIARAVNPCIVSVRPRATL